MMFYAKSTGGFYNEELHGARRILVADPAWTPPLVDGEPDLTAEAPTIEVDNPDCKIPLDAVPVSDAEYAALFAGQDAGMHITADASGSPVLTAPPPETHAAAQVRGEALLRGQRGPILSILDGLQATANTQWLLAYTSTDAATIATADGFKAQAQQIEALKKGLRDAPTAIDWAAYPDFEAMRQAGKVYYLSLVKGAPAAIVSAFAGVA